jgi:hypothetical protein
MTLAESIAAWDRRVYRRLPWLEPKPAPPSPPVPQLLVIAVLVLLFDALAAGIAVGGHHPTPFTLCQ